MPRRIGLRLFHGSITLCMITLILAVYACNIHWNLNPNKTVLASSDPYAAMHALQEAKPGDLFQATNGVWYSVQTVIKGRDLVTFQRCPACDNSPTWSVELASRDIVLPIVHKGDRQWPERYATWSRQPRDVAD
jgi:hypothetical protein